MIIIPILFLAVGIVFVFFSQRIMIWIIKGFYKNNCEYFKSKGIYPPDKTNFKEYFKYMQWTPGQYSDSFLSNFYFIWRVLGTILGGMMILASLAVIIASMIK